jgi:hypothetical protein
MKRKLITLAFLLISLSIAAQDERVKKWEHFVYVGAGVFIENAQQHEKGFSAKIGYGLSYRFAPVFSVMAGVAYHTLGINLFEDAKEGADDDFFEFIDIPLVAQYRLPCRTGQWMLGLGPVLSIATRRDHYYVDADPTDPLNGKAKIKPIGIGLQPSTMYQWKHLRAGVEADIGLRDMRISYGHRLGSLHLHDVNFVLGFCF